MPSGIVFEALNNAGHLKRRLLVILNDNQMSICPRVGALASTLDRARLTNFYQDSKKQFRNLLGQLPILGGMASAALGPGGNRLALDDRIHTSGAVGAVIGPGTRLTTVVSQGCRPIVRPLVVTKSERNIVYELAGIPALERLLEMARAGMSERDISLINQGLHLGLVIDEHKADWQATAMSASREEQTALPDD